MHKMFLLIAVLFSILAATDLSAQTPGADESTPPQTPAPVEKNKRQGIHFALIGFMGVDATETKKATGGGGIRLGGGITEDFLLYLEARNGVTFGSISKNIVFVEAELKGQYYVWRDLYANLGGGVAVTVNTPSYYPTLDQVFKTGFAMSAGAGYEFRVGRSFYLAPEFRLGYKRIGGLNFVTPEVGGALGWHF